MYLGPFKALKKMLTAEFGEQAYTDDNQVVVGETAVACLIVTAPNEHTIVYLDSRPEKKVRVRGAEPSVSTAKALRGARQGRAEILREKKRS